MSTSSEAVADVRGGGFVPLRERLFLRALRAALAGCGRILDVGCGVESPLVRAGVPGALIGYDRSRLDLSAARVRATHAAYVCADAREIGRVVRAGSVDAVVALDVIEHLDKGEAFSVIEAMEAVARRRVVLFTPNGFVPQAGTPENPWQVHRCGFSAGDLRAIGYRVRGTHGPKWLFGSYGRCAWRPGALWRRVADVGAVVAPVAETSYGLLAVKELT